MFHSVRLLLSLVVSFSEFRCRNILYHCLIRILVLLFKWFSYQCKYWANYSNDSSSKAYEVDRDGVGQITKKDWFHTSPSNGPKYTLFSRFATARFSNAYAYSRHLIYVVAFAPSFQNTENRLILFRLSVFLANTTNKQLFILCRWQPFPNAPIYIIKIMGPPRSRRSRNFVFVQTLMGAFILQREFIEECFN